MRLNLFLDWKDIASPISISSRKEAGSKTGMEEEGAREGRNGERGVVEWIEGREGVTIQEILLTCGFACDASYYLNLWLSSVHF